MSRSIKAALLSAFVLPGLGHFYLKRHVLGSAFTAAALAALYFVVTWTVEQAMRIVDRVLSGELEPSVEAIIRALSAGPGGSEAQFLEYAWIALIVVWVAGTLDAYRCGRAADRREAARRSANGLA